MSDPMERFKQVFFDESAEALSAIEQHLLDIDLTAIEPEVINDIFRSAHSLKGGSATFGMSRLAEFTHFMETLLDMVRDGQRDFTQEVVDCLFECLDCLRNLVNHYQFEEQVNGELIAIVEKQLQELIDGKQEGKPVEGSGDSNLNNGLVHGKHWEIHFSPDEELLLSGNEPLRYIEELLELGSVNVVCDSSDVPPLNQLNPIHLKMKWLITLDSEEAISEEDLAEVFLWIEDEATLEYRCLDQEAPQLVSSALAETTKSAPDVKVDTVSSDVDNAETSKAKAPAKRTGQSIRVELSKIDSLINLLGELVITQSMLSTFNNMVQFPELRRLQEGLGQLERHTRDLQDGVMQIRMLPIDFCFSRFPRMVRDLCKQLGKKIDVVIEGENTEVDKTVIEELTDPLVHLVRNSIDHGIEMPDEREALGKPRVGTLKLVAYHQVGNIVIEISDDGKGLAVDKIRAKAVERGLIDANAKLAPQACKELIFAAGFSTADAVTDLSGRGVGMDVVKRNIQSLGGQIDLHSEENEGTTFSIKLPLTLSILDGQLIKVMDETYVVPMLAIIESIKVKRVDINKIGEHDISFKWRSQFIPLLNLAETFSLPETKPDSEDSLLVVVVEHDNQQFGLVVNELANHQQVVVKSLEANYIKVDELSGATILGDGSVALILDVGALMSRLKVH
ncbi:chemotaxis protein CheA [Alteromonas sp. ASW11-36]|uniref:Chemotaxis protein CheA n=1 Tax=Alteromonas arenosi TaxID=3055817 RepID=A0ABT7T0D2_9ALTE|nr:chemotaxis protein CheA [Alteromonas sp. ASW11-36]MDM7861892.1 chemotaxis protein CheA [Alteromonas sp. ASW11-36]